MGHLGFPVPRRTGWPGGGPPSRGEPRVLLDGVHVPAVPRDDVHAGRGEAPGPDHGNVRQRPRGGELRHLAGFAVRPGRDADRFRARGDRDRPGRVPFLPFALRNGGGGLEGRPVSSSRGQGEPGAGRGASATRRTSSSPSFTRGIRSDSSSWANGTTGSLSGSGSSTWPGSSPTTPPAP